MGVYGVLSSLTSLDMRGFYRYTGYINIYLKNGCRILREKITLTAYCKRLDCGILPFAGNRSAQTFSRMSGPLNTRSEMCKIHSLEGLEGLS